MRYRLAGLVLLSSVLCAPSQAQAPAPAPPAQSFDVPAGTPQSVAILTRDFAPGQSAGRHIHHGVEMAIVIRGDFTLMVDGSPPRAVHVGDSWTVPRDLPHDIQNTGATPATLAITYVIDKGTPLRVPVP